MTAKATERLTFYFESEPALGRDLELWREWVAARSGMRSWALQMGEYRPGLRVVPPFLRQTKGELIRIRSMSHVVTARSGRAT